MLIKNCLFFRGTLKVSQFFHLILVFVFFGVLLGLGVFHQALAASFYSIIFPAGYKFNASGYSSNNTSVSSKKITLAKTGETITNYVKNPSFENNVTNFWDPETSTNFTSSSHLADDNVNDVFLYQRPSGSSLELDGTDDYLDCGNDSSLHITGDITIEAWVKTDTVYAGGVIYKYAGSTNTSNYGLIVYNRKIGVRTHTTNGTYILLSGELNEHDISDGRWHHLAGVIKSDDKIEAYVDGVLMGEETITGSVTGDESYPLEIGRRVVNPWNFNGYIDEVRVWNVARTQSQIQANMNTPLSGSETGLVGYWQFDERSGQTVKDLSGNGNNGTLGASASSGSDDPTWRDVSWMDNDSPDDDMVTLDKDPNWANGVVLSSGTLSTTYNGSLVEVAGYNSSKENITLTINASDQTKFDWTDDSATYSGSGVAMNKGNWVKLETGDNDIYVKWDNYNFSGKGGDEFKILSWMIEEPSTTRGRGRAFPQEAYLIAQGASSYTYINIIDAQTDEMWMRFDGVNCCNMLFNGGVGTLTSVFMLNGVLYYGDSETNGGVFGRIDFIEDGAKLAWANGAWAIYYNNIAHRNETINWATQWPTTEAFDDIVNRSVNDIHAAVIHESGVPKTYVGVATAGGVSIIDESDDSVVDGTRGVWEIYNVVVGQGIELSYTANWGGTYEIYTLPTADFELYFDSDAGYAQDGYGGNPTVIGSTIEKAVITKGTSSVGLNTLYITSDGGLSVIQELQRDVGDPREGAEVHNSVKYYTKDYISEEMIGDVRGMWSMYEGSGTAVEDVSVKSNDGTMQNMSASAWVSGVRGKGLEFDGVDNYVSVSDDDSLDMETNDFSVGAWVKTGDYEEDASGTILQKFDATNSEGFVFGIDQKSNDVVFHTDDGSSLSSWSSVDTGTDDTGIDSLGVYEGKLYAGSDNSYGQVMVYDGSSWSLSYDSPSGRIGDFAVYNGSLYASGARETSQGIYIYDGSSWSTSFDSGEDMVGLVVYKDKLYATGEEGIYVYDGSSWSSFSSSLVENEISDSVAVYNDNLYLGVNDGGESKIYQYDGSTLTEAYDTGLTDDHVDGMAVFQGKLYVGGWGELGDGTDIYVYDGSSWSQVDFDSQNRHYQFEVYDGKLYCTSAASGKIYAYDGSSWTEQTSTGLSQVRDIIEYGGKLYAAGLGGTGLVVAEAGKGISTDEELSSEEWHHIVGVKDGDDYLIYIDGSEVVSETLTNSYDLGDSADLYLGRGTNYFNGTLDEVFLTAEALSASQIQNMYHNGYQVLNNAGDDESKLAGSTSIVKGVYVSGDNIYVGTNDGAGGGALSIIDKDGDRLISSYTSALVDRDISSVSGDWGDSKLIVGTDASGASSLALESISPSKNGESKFGSYGAKLDNSANSTNRLYYFALSDSTQNYHTLSLYAKGDVAETSVFRLLTPGGFSAWKDTTTSWVRQTQTTNGKGGNFGIWVAPGKTVYIDAAQLEKTSSASNYIDGSLGSGINWGAQAHQSISSVDVYQSAGTYVSPSIDLERIASWGNFTSTHNLNDGSITYYTRTSRNGSTWSAWNEISGSTLSSPVNNRQYLQIKAKLTAPVVNSIYHNSPEISWLSISYHKDAATLSGDVSINSGAEYVNQREVTLTISAESTSSSVAQMMISNHSNFANASWENYRTSKSWTLASGNGEKTVYIKFRDANQNTSSTYSDTIILDTSTDLDLVTLATQEFNPELVDWEVNKRRPTLSGEAEPGSTITITISSGITGQATADETGAWSWTPEEKLTLGDYTVTILSTDLAGNTKKVSFELGVVKSQSSSQEPDQQDTFQGGISQLPDTGASHAPLLMVAFSFILLGLGIHFSLKKL